MPGGQWGEGGVRGGGANGDGNRESGSRERRGGGGGGGSGRSERGEGGWSSRVRVKVRTSASELVGDGTVQEQDSLRWAVRPLSISLSLRSFAESSSSASAFLRSFRSCRIAAARSFSSTKRVRRMGVRLMSRGWTNARPPTFVSFVGSTNSSSSDVSPARICVCE